MNELREQCPLDKKQTIQSLRYLTIEEVYEPYLIKEGYLQRTTRGRVALDKSYKYLSKTKNKKKDKDQIDIF